MKYTLEEIEKRKSECFVLREGDGADALSLTWRGIIDDLVEEVKSLEARKIGSCF